MAYIPLIFIKRVEVNEFNKSNNAGAQMLDSIYHRTLELFEIISLALRLDFAIHILYVAMAFIS